tara:strand:+ start:386 stop:808 length:423 start_codon:yes stop_codon:yes gene_type:complete
MVIEGLGGLSQGNQSFVNSIGDTSAFWDPKGLGQGVGGATGAGAGGWLTPTLGILLKALGMFGGKKAQSVLGIHNAVGGLAGALLGSNNPFEQNTTDGDKKKDKTIDGNNNLSSLGIGGTLGQVPLDAVGNTFGIGSMFS